MSNLDENTPVVVEAMPDCLRQSHRAARNWGRYPANGAVRETAPRWYAEEIVAADPDEYASIVEGADPSQYPEAQ